MRIGNPRLLEANENEITSSSHCLFAVHFAVAPMRYHALLLTTMALAAAPSGTAFQASIAGLTAARRSTASSSSHVRISMSWRGLLDGVMGRSTESKLKKGGGSGVLTPKSRVKLGDLSVSPMGELCNPTVIHSGTAIALKNVYIRTKFREFRF